MFATTFSIDLLHQIVIITIITYLKTWNFVKIFAKITTLTHFHFMLWREYFI